ncbi:MAG: hypothetical protein ABFS16_15995 [Bacteroidota bacterium]
MNKLLFLSLFLGCLFLITKAQVPDAFNYQAVVRNNSGEVVSNQNVSFRISILQNSETGTSVYSETHNVTTNDFGLANLKIGKGTVLDGVFSPGGWGVALHFIKVELDPNGGSSFVHTGTSQLLAVPYAFHAQTVEEVDDADADATNELQSMTISGTQLTLSDGGGTVTLPSSGGGGDNWGTQVVESDATLSGEGTPANPLSVVGDLTDDQTLSVSGSDLTISEGNTVALPTSTSPWQTENDNIYYTTGKVGVGVIPTDLHLRQFMVETSKLQAIGCLNNSSIYGTIFGENLGSGPAADFRNHLRIFDGTQGAGKVLTSDANGNTSWQTPGASGNLWSQSGDHIYYPTGNVAIGSSYPGWPHDLQISDEEACASLSATTSSAYIDIDRKTMSPGSALTIYGTDGTRKFRTGLYSESVNYWISAENTTLLGLEVQTDGDVSITEDLFMESGKKIGIGDINPNSDIDINSPNPGINIKSTVSGTKSGSAYLILDKKETIKNADIVYRSNGASKFYTGLLGNDNYRISTSTSSLNGVEVESDGDVELSDELHSSSTGNANMMPVAYGAVSSGGSITSGSGNFSVSKSSTGRYSITITGETYANGSYITCLTIIAYTGIIHSGSNSGNLIINTYNKSGTAEDLAFSFIVYKP